MAHKKNSHVPTSTVQYLILRSLSPSYGVDAGPEEWALVPSALMIKGVKYVINQLLFVQCVPKSHIFWEEPTLQTGGEPPPFLTPVDVPLP